MANSKHREILGRGVNAWNEWREENPGVIPDLSGSNIKIKELAGVNFKGADLRGALLAGADLEGAVLDGADLSKADLMEANLHKASVKGANLEKANLMGANLNESNLEDTKLNQAILYRTDLKDLQCACSCLWFDLLMDFASGLQAVDGREQGFYFEEMEESFIENSFVSTKNCKLEIILCEPVSARASYEILGALNRLYREISDRDLVGPIIQIGVPEDEGD